MASYRSKRIAKPTDKYNNFCNDINNCRLKSTKKGFLSMFNLLELSGNGIKLEINNKRKKRHPVRNDREFDFLGFECTSESPSKTNLKKLRTFSSSSSSNSEDSTKYHETSMKHFDCSELKDSNLLNETISKSRSLPITLFQLNKNQTTERNSKSIIKSKPEETSPIISNHINGSVTISSSVCPNEVSDDRVQKKYKYSIMNTRFKKTHNKNYEIVTGNPFLTNGIRESSSSKVSKVKVLSGICGSGTRNFYNVADNCNSVSDKSSKLEMILRGSNDRYHELDYIKQPLAKLNYNRNYQLFKSVSNTRKILKWKKPANKLVNDKTKILQLGKPVVLNHLGSSIINKKATLLNSPKYDSSSTTTVRLDEAVNNHQHQTIPCCKIKAYNCENKQIPTSVKNNTSIDIFNDDATKTNACNELQPNLDGLLKLSLPPMCCDTEEHDSPRCEEFRSCIKAFLEASNQMVNIFSKTLEEQHEIFLKSSSEFTNSCQKVVNNLAKLSENIELEEMENIITLFDKEQEDRKSYKNSVIHNYNFTQQAHKSLYEQMMKLLKTL